MDRRHEESRNWLLEKDRRIEDRRVRSSEMDEKLRLDSYYYDFNATGLLEIDKILERVAGAGRSFHHTDQWSDKEPHGVSKIDLIQEAAESATRFINFVLENNRALQSQLEASQQGVSRLRKGQ